MFFINKILRTQKFANSLRGILMKKQGQFILIVIILFLFFLFFSCPSPIEKERVATPVISLVDGDIYSLKTISITCETEGATIYYSTDGSEPTTSSSVYEGPFIIDAGTVKAMAAKEAYLNSIVASQLFILATGVTISTDFPWTRFIGSSSEFDTIEDLVVDSEGYVYVTGNIGYNAEDGRENDVFVAKYDSRGVRQWIKYKGGPDVDKIKAIRLDSLGNIYLLGSTWNSFDGQMNSNSDIFLIKFDKDGNHIWTKFYNRNNTSPCAGDYAGDFAMDGNFIYVLGHSEEGEFVDEIKRITLILKYDTSGNFKGGIEVDNTNLQVTPKSMLMKDSNNIFIVVSEKKNYLTSEKYYLMRFDSNLSRTMEKEIPELRYSRKMSMDSNGFIYLVGSKDKNIYLLKLDSNGNIQNQQYFGGSSLDIGYDIYIDSENNKYIVGSSSSSFDGQTNKGGEDIILIKLNSSDVKQYVVLKGGSKDDVGYSICVTKSSGKNIIYIVGKTAGSFDGQTSNGYKDGFITKYIEE